MAKNRPRVAARDRLPASRSPGRGITGAALLLVALTLVAYLPALEAGFVWDDDDYVTANPTLQSADGLRRIWLEPGAVPQYYPLTFTSFWLEYHLWGPRPLGYHLVNVVLHALNAVLLWLVLRRLRVPAAWVAAAVFALHPMQVESVAWVTERKNVLSGLFVLAATLVYGTGEGTSWRSYVGAAMLFLCALLSKTVTSALPAVLLVVAWWQRGGIDRPTASRLAPLFAVGIPMAAITVWMERHHVGAVGEEWALSPVARGLVAGRALWFYPRTLLWPSSLTFVYPRWTIDPRVWWQYLFPAAAVAVMIAFWVTRRRIGRGPLAATLCYTATIAPALGFVNVFPMRYSFVADHFAYLAIIPPIAAGAALAKRAVGAAPFGQAACGAVLLTLAGLTARQCTVYHDLRTLWTDTLAKNATAWIAENNLGGLLLKEGAVEDGIAHLRAALRLKPDNPQAENDLGVALDMQGKPDEAITHYLAALRLNPAYANAHCNLGDTLRLQGKLDDAIQHYREALRLKPDYPEAHYRLGNGLRARGDLATATAEYAAALRLRPAYPEAHNNLGLALIASGRIEDGIAHLEQAVRGRPDYAEAQFNLGTALAGQGRLDEAASHFVAGLRTRPESAEAHHALGSVFLTRGRVREAIGEYQHAVRIRAAYPEAETHLGVALAADGRTAEAISHLEAALRLKPDDAEARRQLERLRPP